MIELRIEDEGDSLWGYVLISNKIINDCWLCNFIPPPNNVDAYKAKRLPPPCINGCTNEKSTFDKKYLATDSKIISGNAVFYLNGMAVGIASITTKISYNKYLLRDCPWGNKWMDLFDVILSVENN